LESIKAAYLEVVKIVQADKDIPGFIQNFCYLLRMNHQILPYSKLLHDDWED